MSRLPGLLQSELDGSRISQGIPETHSGLPRYGVNGQEPESLDPAQLERIRFDHAQRAVSELFLNLQNLLLGDVIWRKVGRKVPQFPGFLVTGDDPLELSLRDALHREQLLRVVLQYVQRMLAEARNDGLRGLRPDALDEAGAEIRYDAGLVVWHDLLKMLHGELHTVL